MSTETLLEIKDVFFVRGRGLILIPNMFLSITPQYPLQAFDDYVSVIRPDGTTIDCVAHFHIMHFSAINEAKEVYSKFSLCLLLADKAASDIPAGSQLKVSETVFNYMKDMTA